jgi:hypothetical protein
LQVIFKTEIDAYNKDAASAKLAPWNVLVNETAGDQKPVYRPDMKIVTGI